MPYSSSDLEHPISPSRRLMVLLLAGFNARDAWGSRTFRIGVLSRDPWSYLKEPIVKELARLGFVEGRNLTFSVRTAGENLVLPDKFAAELVALKVDAILAQGGELF